MTFDLDTWILRQNLNQAQNETDAELEHYRNNYYGGKA